MKRANIVIFIYKLFVVLGCVSFILLFAIPILATIIEFYYADMIMFCIWLCFGLVMLSGLVLLIITFAVNKKDIKSFDTIFSLKKKITPISINVYKFDELISSLNARLIFEGYKKTECYQEHRFELHLYFKSIFRVNSSIFVVAYSRELTDEIVEIYETIITNYLEQSNVVLFGHINVVGVICVDHLSHCFNKTMDSGVNQDFDLGRFWAGISFGGGKLYIAPQNHKFANLKYNKNKRTLMNCINFLFSPRE